MHDTVEQNLSLFLDDVRGRQTQKHTPTPLLWGGPRNTTSVFFRFRYSNGRGNPATRPREQSFHPLNHQKWGLDIEYLVWQTARSFPSYPVCWTSSWHAQHSFLHFTTKIKLVFVIVIRPSRAERTGTGWFSGWKDWLGPFSAFNCTSWLLMDSN